MTLMLLTSSNGAWCCGLAPLQHMSWAALLAVARVEP